MHGCQRVCVVARGRGCWGRHVWLLVGHAWLLGGMCGCWGVCMVASRACMVARGCVWLGGHVWWLGSMHGIQRDTVNERAVRILLECILVLICTPAYAHS